MKTPEQLKQEVLHGLWGDGDTRRQRLENAGYSWIEIQSLINKEFGSKVVIASDEEIAQEVLDGKWGLGAMRRQRVTNAGFDYNKIQSLANKMASAKKSAGTTTPSVPTVPSQPNIETPAGKIDVGGGGSQHVNPNGPGAGSSLTTDFTKYNGKISNCGKDEYGGARGGRAGDQTGKEWWIINWYSQGWQCVLRHPDRKVREYIAELGIEAAENNNVGYDQAENRTYWQQLEAVGYWPKKITVPCETDCSAGVTSNVKAVGYLLNMQALKNVKITWTGEMRAELRAAGFQVLTDRKYLTSSDYLLPGDIILNDSQHTATSVGYGKYTQGQANIPTPTDPNKHIVTASVLNVRSGPGMGNSIVGQLTQGTEVNIKNTVSGQDGGKWYQIDQGYVLSNYIS